MMWTANEQLRTARNLMNLSLAEFAGAINEAGTRAGELLRCDARRVAKWEAGQIRWPQGRYRRALEVVTGRSCMELGFAPPHTQTRGRPVEADPSTVDLLHDAEDSVHRRRFIATAASMAVPASRTEPGVGSRVDGAYVQTAEHTLDQLEGLEQRFGGGHLLPLVEQQVTDIAATLDAGADVPGLHSVAAWAHMLAGWVNYDTGNQGRARYLYKEALYMAQLANDHDMTVCVASVMSCQSTYVGRAAEAVRLAQLGSGHGPRSGPVAALLAMREARAWAMLGAEREATAATRRAMDAHAASGPTPRWARFFGEGELLGQAARNAWDLGQWEQAEQLTERATQDSTMPLRARVLFTLDLAEMLARRGDVAAAAAILGQVIPSIGQVSSERVAARLRTMAALPVDESPAAAVWRDQLEAAS